jgi:hypothetical protein
MEGAEWVTPWVMPASPLPCHHRGVERGSERTSHARDAAAGAAWGFAEGTLFFIVPDVLLTRTALASPRRALGQCLATVMGAVLAGLLLYAWASADPGAARRAVAAVPWVRASMFETAGAALATAPLPGMLRGAVTGLPYKVFAVEAPPRLGLAAFLGFTVLARLPRFVLATAFAAAVAALLRRWPGLGLPTLHGLHAVSWVGFYGYYWSVI